ncbi:MAG: riboflavin biosynthesis protein RibF [Hyphomonas sp.]|uniref:riboflavin biosynthesis protein RibF n=1 Tax=Hyphomonas sp. TaxID=87 RepID=UPI001828F0E9|nr:riboflavin biosynthesis protein RibF [Hyphomonas sp.]MBU3919922.1 riboflavin biosynthesis protein RibF [Alphaproteobacteria bacterium]MBA3067075.1 riboflavin biosynthesis protein RibF [Hyphomonas sp.]MBU4063130.1 riboflavin biosynthesis protein RibF [Alphaproteobacteria bacterium]MBU4164447.1 riboflavin biosynthesis protein RibF [Alphaproteobacteria bacterium]MBU4569248.1 riboflavin biosynthesis protein RibF [Alphaproteobacteria bacterium]
MAVFADYRGLPASARGASIALGNFDGLHAGHRAVMEAARLAGHGKFSVATFEPPPRAYFRPGDPPFRIFRPERRNAAILASGAATVFELPFNGEMASMTDEGFVRTVLVDGLGVTHISVGFDFRFGRGRMGHAQRLSSLGRALGFGVTVVEEVEGQGAKASSTAIRQALMAGEPELAAEMLGGPWVADGVVESGERNGRKLGFPTANFQLGELIHPKHGVYAVRAKIEGEANWRPGVANFGRTPTTGLRDPLLETHIFDFTGDLYGRKLDVQMIAYLRPERRFDSLELMVEQMHKDAARARAILATPG